MIRTFALTRTFGSKTAVRELQIEIPQGELFCFLGPNGAGKTTTIKMLTGLLRPTAGRVLIGGHDVQLEPIPAKGLLGYVPDRPFLYEKLTGHELLRFVAGLYRLSDDTFARRCEELLHHFELAHVADRLIESYSHGMRQKLSFAACFLHAPRVVVIDEPWVGLDPGSVRRIKDDLLARRRKGLTIFMSTHSLAIAEEMADRIGIIDHGRLLHLGTVAEIKAIASSPGSLEDVFLELTRGPSTMPVGETAA